MFRAEKDLKQEDIQELYYILPITNLESLLEKGILSHNRARRVAHQDISSQSVQGLRDKLIVRANGRRPLTIHQHANFYLTPHNAMMYMRHEEDVCVVRVRREIFDRGDGVLSTCNAARGEADFFPATDWKMSQNDAQHLASRSSIAFLPQGGGIDQRHKVVRQAEALFPYEVRPKFIGAIFVKTESDEKRVQVILKKAGREDVQVEVHPSALMHGGSRKRSRAGKEYYDAPRLATFQPMRSLSPASRQKLDFSLPDSSDDESSTALASAAASTSGVKP